MRVVIVALVVGVLASGCIATKDEDAPRATFGDVATPEARNLWDLPLPEHNITSNRYAGFESRDTVAAIVHVEQDVRVNGNFNGPFAMVPMSALTNATCTAAAATLRGFPGATPDSTTTPLPAGSYMMLSFGSSGYIYFSGFSRNEGDTVTKWLSVGNATTFRVDSVHGRTDGLDAEWEATLDSGADGRTLLMAGYRGSDSILTPEYFTKVGQPEGRLEIGDCAGIDLGGSLALPVWAEQLVVSSPHGNRTASVSLERPFDLGDHVLTLAVIGFNPVEAPRAERATEAPSG